MNPPRWEILAILLILWAIISILLFAFLRRLKKSRYERNLHSEPDTREKVGGFKAVIELIIFEPWIASITLFLMLAATLFFVLTVRSSPVPSDPPNLLAVEVRSLANQVGGLAARLDRLRPPPDQGTTQGVDQAQLEEIENQLRHISARMAAAEAGLARQPAPWSWPKILIVLLIAAATAGAVWLFWKRSPWAAALVATVGLGSVTLISIEPDSLVSFRVDRIGGMPSPDSQAVLLLVQGGADAGERRAYAIPFAEGAHALSPQGATVVGAIATALGPCIQTDGEEPPLTLTVVGFASSAPFVGQSRPNSNQSNMRLADERAQAVHEQLSREFCPGGPCSRDRGVVISVAPAWRDYNRMMGRQLVGDASEPEDQRRAAELLTRTALVMVDHPGRCAIR